MRGFYFIAAAFLAAAPMLGAQTPETEIVERLDSAAVVATRAGKNTPVTYTTVGKKQLRGSSPLNSIPMTLGLQPSVVAVNEGGTGLGYSKMKVRGVSGSQTNVTLNGITLNDAESQEVFWVNIPALSTMLSSVQLQRGLGTSEAGAGAFGASINMNTSGVSSSPSGSFEVAGGSYGTMMTTVRASTGLSKHGFYADAVFSYDQTDGYIRNAKAKVNSILGVAGWMNGSNSLKLTFLRGEQHSGITWNGIPYATVQTDRTYNPAGEYYDAQGNVQYYDNETDNYVQSHLQLNYVHKFGENLTWNTTLNWTNGDGYYEQYKAGKKGTKYGYDWKDKTDFIIQKKMLNNYYVASSDLNCRTDVLNLTGGIYLSSYDGDHFGDVIWNGKLGDVSDRWYLNNGTKKEFNAFVRGEYSPSSEITFYGDVQLRAVGLDMTGPDDDGASLDYSTDWLFCNPRAGVTYNISEKSKVYASAAIGHREPGRSDLKANIATVSYEGGEVTLKPEEMLDFELGWSRKGKLWSASANLYAMEYKNMLLETGKLSDSGYAIKENVDRGYRRGIELALAWTPGSKYRMDWNCTISANKIKDYTAFVENYDADWNYLGQVAEKHETTDMLLSPSKIWMASATYMPWKNWSFNVTRKYVGSQYWDNTSCADRKIPAYKIWNFSAAKDFKVGPGNINLALYVGNLFNKNYYADAWVYRAYVGGELYQEEGLFPQALRNVMLKLTFSF